MAGFLRKDDRLYHLTHERRFKGHFRPNSGFWAIFDPVTNKISSSCLLERFGAAINGANPAKFIPQKHKRKRKAGRFTHPVTVKKHRNPKRNKDFGKIPRNPYLCVVFYHRIAPDFQRPVPGSMPGTVFLQDLFYMMLCPIKKIQFPIITRFPLQFVLFPEGKFPQCDIIFFPDIQT